MSLTDVVIDVVPGRLPDEIAELLAEADARIERFSRTSAHMAKFVPSDFVTAYWSLCAIREQGLSTGSSFCEWGSGFGVVALMAATLGFEACGIEIEGELVDEARALAEDFELDVEFVEGSFVPLGGETITESEYATSDDGLFWLTTESDRAYDELGLEVDDFDFIFAYPWPGEQQVVERLFDRYACAGALLMTCGHLDHISLQRKK